MTNIKRNMKRLTAALLSLLMALVLLAPSAFAEGNATITVNRPSGMTEDLSSMQGNAYLVLEQVNPDETDPAKFQYKVTEDFKPFFAMRNGTDELDATIKGYFGQANQNVVLAYDATLNKITFSNPGAGAQATAGTIVLTGDDAAKLDETYPEADLVSRLTGTTTNVSNVATFYTWVEKYIEANKVSLTPTEATAAEAALHFNGLREGYYALTFSNVPNGISVKQGILVATDESKSATINLKAEEIPLTKQVQNQAHTDNTGKLEDYASNTTAEIGNILNYKITSKVPTLTDTDNLTSFTLSDTMQKQMLTAGDTMTLTVGSVTFETTVPTIAGGAESATANFEDASSNVIAVLTVKPYNDTDKTQEFTIDFLADAANDNWTRYQGAEITLTYSAKLTADAYNINLNTITLTIDNNNDETTQTASTEVYTYGIDVLKTFSDGKTTEHSDAVTFELRATKGGDAIQLVETSDGNYRKPVTGDTTNPTKDLKLDPATGKLTITGLDVGTYWLVETEAPEAAGFTKAEPIEIVLVQDDTNKEKLDESASTAKYNGDGQDLLSVVEQDATSISMGHLEVLNQKGFNLPQTGGAGTWMFTVGGIVLIAVAGGLFIASRKKSSSK